VTQYQIAIDLIPNLVSAYMNMTTPGLNRKNNRKRAKAIVRTKKCYDKDISPIELMSQGKRYEFTLKEMSYNIGR